MRLHQLVCGSTGPDIPYSILTVAKKFELEPAALFSLGKVLPFNIVFISDGA